MLFSSVTFLYYFLPVVLVLYFFVLKLTGSPKFCNWVLLAASLVFYAWGEPVYVLLMAGQSFSGWFFGVIIETFHGRPAAKAALAASLVVGVGGLAVFKYSDFFVENINALLHSPLPPPGIALPIGISFYTFQILSYTIDLYRGRAPVQRNFLDFSAYVMLFPQLIAGPIVRYVDVASELTHREHTIGRFAEGARRFVLGLGKKVLIANVLGELVEIYKGSSEQSVLFAWLYIIAYALHIYFDFSGYSDMAIGLGRIFGFRFPENFNYPYMAGSITEFWRRWHMSLSGWFRDYVYIPLGGGRVSAPKRMRNILAVWLLTGFWHGAGWNFIAWGLYFAVLLLAEKFVLGRILARAPAFLPHVYAMLCVLVSWVFFDAPDFSSALSRLSVLFGAGADSLAGTESCYYLRSYLLPLLIAVFGCTPAPARIVARLVRGHGGERAFAVLEPLCVAALLIVITAYLVDGSFNPFIYFRF
ncbi:MAG: MBOAT family protein [Clostridiales Family XIII bacterium]|jgi:alginate O-acetyltransferase complex protein AlgI|nr:MBOAT family protein [Clostridiales Family XIII bacterium]